MKTKFEQFERIDVVRLKNVTGGFMGPPPPKKDDKKDDWTKWILM